ncbi:MAG: dTDP-4-dehydrorhamnose reductase [Treponema sp.]|jgi:dTDP-4-dehydrorhamnose reductase|nr:dTDP-4-dehydrorhamnose reductase [Treponema sp.]
MIWLTGSKGMLGTEIALLLEKTGLPFVGTDRELDITDLEAQKFFVNNKSIKWIINCAAYTAVDKAEDDIEACRRLNILGAGNIASCAKNIGASLIHISTDYVFNGKGNRPYNEEDTTDPTGVYGLSKRDGELVVLKNNPNSYIIRTAWLYGKYGNNFVHTMLRLMNEREEVKVVDDQRGSPTWTHDLASVVLAVIGKDFPFGVYHYTNEGNITWFDFAKEIYRLGREYGRVTKECTVTPCTSAEFPAKVKRPAYSVLDKSKIKAALGINIPAWDRSLKEFFKTG